MCKVEVTIGAHYVYQNTGSYNCGNGKISGYAVLVEKAGHFLEKVGLVWKKPYFFSVGQVLVI